GAAIKDWTTETYALADVMFKMANYYYTKDQLTRFYKADGQARTAEQLEREAADITNAPNITYSRPILLVKVAEMSAITKFGVYFSEALIRVPIMNVVQTVADFQRAKQARTPEAKKIARAMATRRAIGTSMAMGIIPALLAQGIGALSDDDEKEPWLRALLPEFARYRDLVYLGNDEKGSPTFFDLGRSDPFGPMTDLIRMGIHADDVTPSDIGKY